MRFLNRTRGFSLFEVLLTMTLAMLLFALGLPSFKPFLEHSREQALLDTLLQALQMARREALSSYSLVSLCQTNDQIHCGGEWQNGFMVYSAMQILYVFHFPAAGGRLEWRSFPRQQNSLQFLPSGMTQQENGSFGYCPAGKTAPAWVVNVAQSGNWQVLYPDKQGKIEDERGRLWTCHQQLLSVPEPLLPLMPCEFSVKLPQRGS